MGLIPTLVAFTAGTLIKAADFNTNYDAIVNAFNNTAVLTDVAKTISVAHTFAADILFADALYDIGKSGATRPRDGFFSRHLTVGGTLKSSSQIVGDANAQKEIFLQPGDPSGRVVFRSSASVELSAILNSGIWLHGGPASAGSAVAGDIVLANNKTLRASNFAGTDSIALLKLNVGNVIHLAPTAGAVAIGTGVADSGLAAGELGLANNKALRGTNTAGNAMLELIRTQSDSVYIGSNIPGVVMIGTPATNSGATYGDLVLTNAKYLRSANYAGTSTRILIGSSVDAGAREAVLVGATVDVPIAIGVPVTYLNAAGGELLLANAKAIRGVNAAGTDTFELIRATAGNAVAVGFSGGQTIVLGSPGSVAGAAAAEVVMQNNKNIRASNAANSDSKRLLSLDANDRLILGADVNIVTPQAVFFGAFVTATAVSAGEAVLQNTRALKGVNVAGTNTINLVSVDASDRVRIGQDPSVVMIGAPSTSGAAGVGEVVIANNKGIYAANAAGSAVKSLVLLNASDQVVLSASGLDIKWGRALVALGGGAAPTLGTIGGSGPATAAQNSWMHVVDSAGNPFWVPLWK